MIVCWWSGGVTSAVACKLACDLFGVANCRFIMIDTMNEHEDTYRFKSDCEVWYGKEIEIIKSDAYNTIQEVWIKHKSLNVAHGAICSSELKRVVREKWQKSNDYTHQVFGFDFSEFNRAKSMNLNHPKAKAIFPLLMYGLSKEACIKMIEDAGILIPEMYKLGFHNNNCFKTGCVQGGVGYWKKIQREYPDKFRAMAEMEHRLTGLKGEPVTMLKDQSAQAKLSGNYKVFLIKHPLYPNLKCIEDMKDTKVQPLFECNGFCGINDLEPQSTTQQELNFE